MNDIIKKTPWHLWVVGVVSLLWNAMGAMDFIMTQSRSEAWLSNFTEAQLDFFNNVPGWVVVFWAAAVFGAVAGSVLLLMRSKFAFPVFAVSLVAMLVTTVRNYVMANAFEVTGAGAAVFSLIIFGVGLALVWYSRSMQTAGVLA